MRNFEVIFVRKKAELFIKTVKVKLRSTEFMDANRFSKRHFTRQRKLPFTTMVCFLLNSVKQTLQKELTNFIRLISDNKNVTKSAFSQQRMKLKPDAFVELNESIIHEFYTDNEYETWNGFRLLGIDGSMIELPRDKNVYESFGGQQVGETITPMAQISTCYDLLNNMIIDGHIENYKTSEYTLAVKHLQKCGEGDLVIFDRGYCAYWLWYYLHVNKIDFVCRLQQSLSPQINSFWESDQQSMIVDLEQGYKGKKVLSALGITPQKIQVRLVKFKLDNGETEVLATSLFDQEKYPVIVFKELYNKRWNIETNYDHLKNHIEVGNFTGYSTAAIKQDFFASLFISNMQSIIIKDAQEKLDEKKKNNKRQYKINRNLSLGFMKDRMLQIITTQDNTNALEELKELFLLEPTPIRKNRKFKRRKNLERPKHYMNKRRSL